MASGFCPVCDRRVPIEARGWGPGERKRQRWVVSKHPEQGNDTGGPDCKGVGRLV